MCVDFLLTVIKRIQADATTHICPRECGIRIIDVKIHGQDAFTMANEKCRNGRVVNSVGAGCLCGRERSLSGGEGTPAARTETWTA